MRHTDPSNVFVYSLGDSSWAFGFDADNSGCLKYNGQAIASENYEQWQREDELLKPLASDVSGIQLLNTIIRGTDLSGITIGDGNTAEVVTIRWRWGRAIRLVVKIRWRWGKTIRRAPAPGQWRWERIVQRSGSIQ